VPNPVSQARGGYRTASIYSGFNSGAVSLAAAPGAFQGGVGGTDILLYSGQGRLGVIIPMTAASGTSIQFYDGVAPTSGGPFVASGHRVIGVLPANTIGQGTIGTGPLPVFCETPFFSGLCVGNKSGHPGFTVGFSPESTTY